MSFIKNLRQFSFFLIKKDKKETCDQSIYEPYKSQEPEKEKLYIYKTYLNLTIRISDFKTVKRVGFEAFYASKLSTDRCREFHWKEFYTWFLTKTTPVFVLKHNNGAVTINRKDIVFAEYINWIPDYEKPRFSA